MTLGAIKGHTAELRHRIIVKSRSTTQDNIGGEVESLSTRYASEPAKFEQVSGGEFLRGRKIDAQTTAIFTVNFRSGYTVTDVITFQSKTYGIVRIDAPEGVNRYLEIQAKVVG